MRKVTINNHPVTFNNGFCNATELGKALGKPFIDWYLDNVVHVVEIANLYDMPLEKLIQVDYSKSPYEVWTNKLIIDDYCMGTGNHATIMTQLEIGE